MNYDPMPKRRTLEDSIKADNDILTELLCDYYEQNNSKPLIDEAYELRYPSMLQYNDLLDQALMLQGPDEKRIAYQSFHFALHTAKLLDWDLTKPTDLYDYFTKFPSGISIEDLCEAMVDDAQQYLAHKEVLDSLISGFMPEMTQTPSTGRQCEIAMTVAGLTFMQIEDSVNVRRADGIAMSFVDQLKHWDDDIPKEWQ